MLYVSFMPAAVGEIVAHNTYTENVQALFTFGLMN